MEELNILTLNNKDFVISKMICHNHRRYVLLEEINQQEHSLNNRFIGRLVTQDGEDSIEKVEESSKEYQEIAKIFFELLVD